MQAALPLDVRADPVFPGTRYQGSKAKIVSWLIDYLASVQPETVLDAFGGTGVVGYSMKLRGCSVTYNDLLPANVQVGKALIENATTVVSEATVDALLDHCERNKQPGFIASTFDDVYFTHEENVWLDAMAPAIAALEHEYERAIAYFALFQACIAKRPYNLFHRKNLYMRFADVERTFGNKKTWDTPFPEMFRRFVLEANEAVFDNGKRNNAVLGDAVDIRGSFDLVYVDTPYISAKGMTVDYGQFYHFLDGLVMYDEWPSLVDMKSKHRRLKPVRNRWNDKKAIHGAFADLFDRFAGSTIAVSYRSDGIPEIDEIVALLAEHKASVEVHTFGEYTYALSTNRRSKEVLILAS